MKKDKYESESDFNKRLGIDYKNESKYIKWSKKVRDDFPLDKSRLGQGVNSYVNWGRRKIRRNILDDYHPGA